MERAPSLPFYESTKKGKDFRQIWGGQIVEGKPLEKGKPLIYGPIVKEGHQIIKEGETGNFRLTPVPGIQYET